MAHFNRSIANRLIVIAAMLLAMPLAASAQSGATQGVWLVAATAAESDQTIWGRLTLKDGMLTFAGPSLTWQSPAADIKRVSEAKGVSRQFAVETTAGDKMLFSILGIQMTPESPGKAIQVIERAVKAAPPARTVAAAAAGAGGSF